MNIFEFLIVQPIFNILVGIYSIIPGSDFGVSLIVFTILVRFLMYPLVKRQLHQTKMMQKLQPELKKIKAKAKGNRQVEGMQMMELYKRHGVSPFRSIGILLIQLPIFFALFQVIQIFTRHRDEIARYTYDFMENLGAIRYLIDNPDKFNEKLFGVIDLTKAAISPEGISFFLIALALVAAATQYIMARQTMPKASGKKGLRQIMAEAADGKQADQSEINMAVMGKMATVLPVLMFFIMISVPGALALYYAVSNIVAVAQQAYLLREDEEELEEIADQLASGKKATAKAREKAARPAKTTSSNKTNVTRISAKDTKSRRKK